MVELNRWVVHISIQAIKRLSNDSSFFSETDFVARNKMFHILLNSIVQVCLARAQTLQGGEEAVAVSELTKEALASTVTEDGKTLGDLVALNIGQIGENLILKRAVLLKASRDEVGHIHCFLVVAVIICVMAFVDQEELSAFKRK